MRATHQNDWVCKITQHSITLRNKTVTPIYSFIRSEYRIRRKENKTAALSDSILAANRRNCLVAQSNTVLSYFGELPALSKLKLTKVHGSSLYGSELWDLSNG